jgi:hypothetical protein
VGVFQLQKGVRGYETCKGSNQPDWLLFLKTSKQAGVRDFEKDLVPFIASPG